MAEFKNGDLVRIIHGTRQLKFLDSYLGCVARVTEEKGQNGLLVVDVIDVVGSGESFYVTEAMIEPVVSPKMTQAALPIIEKYADEAFTAADPGVDMQNRARFAREIFEAMSAARGG